MKLMYVIVNCSMGTYGSEGSSVMSAMCGGRVPGSRGSV